MNILIIAYYYPPISTGGTMRPLKFAKYLARKGHKVTVVTQSYVNTHLEPGNPQILRYYDISHNKNRSHWRRWLQWLGLRLFTEALNRLGIYHSIYSWWKRSVIKNSDAIIDTVRPDIIFATYPPVETLEIGTYLSERYNIPLIADFRDGLMFEPIESKRMQRYACIRSRYRAIETQTINQCSAVTAIAQPIIDYYTKTYHPPFARVISNAFDPDDLEQLPTAQCFEPGYFNIVFTGRFGLSDKNNRVDFFFDAVRQLVNTHPDLAQTLRIHLAGEYRKEELREIHDLIDSGLVIVHGFVNRSIALAMQRDASLLLIITLPDRVSSVSAKIFEYLYAGKPILALTYKTVLEAIIDSTGTGWNVHPQKPDAIAGILKQIITDPAFRETINPDWEIIKQYSVPYQIEKLEGLFSTLLSK